MTTPGTAQLTLYEIGNVILGNIVGTPYGYGAYGYGTYGYGVGQPVSSIQMGPQLARVWWMPSSIFCSTPSQALSTFYLYRNGTSQAQLIGWTLSGNGDSVSFIGGPLTAGEFLVGVWYGGDLGVQATMTVLGQKQVPGGTNAG